MDVYFSPIITCVCNLSLKELVYHRTGFVWVLKLHIEARIQFCSHVTHVSLKILYYHILVYFGGKKIWRIQLKTPNFSTTNPILIGACTVCALKR